MWIVVQMAVPDWCSKASQVPKKFGKDIESMIKRTRNSLKFNKLLECIFKLKVKLLNTEYYSDISNIDQRARMLFEIYNDGKTVKEEVKIKMKNIAKQNSYLKYQHYVKNKDIDIDKRINTLRKRRK